jgi:hypothetical protein
VSDVLAGSDQDILLIADVAQAGVPGTSGGYVGESRHQILVTLRLYLTGVPCGGPGAPALLVSHGPLPFPCPR